MTGGEKSTSHSRGPLKILLLEGTADDHLRLSRLLTQSAEDFLLLDGVHKHKAGGDMQLSYKELLDFTLTASHDLKAPLRHILTRCEILRDEYAHRIGPDGGEHIDRMVKNATRLQRLVDDLLAYSEALDGAEELREVDVEDMARQALEFLEDALIEEKAQVIIEKLPRITAYPLRIRQLLQNLFSNALKYRADNPPQISLACEETPDAFKFSIADNGLGVETEYQEMIFDAFRRLHSRDQIEGSGLGLSICKKIVARHKGRIWVESALGKGSTFYFTISKALTPQ